MDKDVEHFKKIVAISIGFFWELSLVLIFSI